MSRKKATLILDPNRRREQMAYVSERAEILHEVGGQLWVSITEAQASRFAERGILVQLYEEADLVELPATVFDPLEDELDPPASLRAAEPTGDARAYYLVQFVTPADPAWIDEIIGLGGTFVQNVPINAGAFRLNAHQASAAKMLEYVRWIGIYHPAYALSHQLAVGAGSFIAPSLRDLAVDPESLPPPRGTGNVRIRLFDDVSPDEARPSVEAAGVTIVAGMGYGFVVDSDAPKVQALLRVPGVFAVEINHPVAPGNDRAGAITGVSRVQNFRKVDFLVNLDGTGEIVGVLDNGLDAGVVSGIHEDLAGRVLEINNVDDPGKPVADRRKNPAEPKDPTDYWHGTHVTGTIAGDGTKSWGRIRGVAPACRVIFFGPVSSKKFDFERALARAHDAGARVHNNSWGGPDDEITDNFYYVGSSDIVDRFCFTHPDSLVVFGSGNSEKDVKPEDGFLDMNRLTYHAVAKNVLTVGAVESQRRGDGFGNDYRTFYPDRYNHPDLASLAAGPVGAYPMSDNPDQVALFSNRGPVNAKMREKTNGGTKEVTRPVGRVKPDLVAPGTNILSLRSSLASAKVPSVGPYAGWMDPKPQTCDPRFYGLMHGTSMAAPQVSGAAILARQYYRARFGQLRRPLLLEHVGSITDLPSIAPHRDGRVVAWIHHDEVSGQNHIVAARYSRDWVRLGGIVQLQSAVGDHPAPMLARHGNNTLLLYRASDNAIRLSLYDAALSPVNAFGSDGTVMLAPTSRSEDSRRPAMCVHGDEVAVVWNQSSTDTLLFRRFRAGSGAVIDPAPQSLGNMTLSSSHPFIVHNGTHYAVVWAHQEDTERKLRMRLVDNSGAPEGARPKTLMTQTADIRDPHLVWDTRQRRFLVAWAGSDAHPGGDLRYIFADPTAAPIGAANTALTVPAANLVRRPYVALHPDAGYVLLWEDDTQGNHHDVYVTFLDNAGQPDRIPPDPSDPPIAGPPARPPRRLLRVSDTPEDTLGFTALVDTGGAAVVWQSHDEINSDRLGVYGLNVTRLGAFQAQVDPNTPLIDSGRYKNHTLLDHTATTFTSVSMVWAAGTYYMLRRGPRAKRDHLEVVKTNADGLIDPTYGVNGARSLTTGRFFRRHELHSVGHRLVCASVGTLSGPHVFLLEATGEPVRGFGSKGTRRINERNTASTDISPQLGHYVRPDFGVIVAYGTGRPPLLTIRYAVLNESGGFVTAPRDLARAKGTAPHGWFHFVQAEDHSIAAWHREVGDDTTVFVNRYDRKGEQHQPGELRLTTLGGDSRNAVIAPRPVAVNTVSDGIVHTSMGNEREYGVAWQYRASNADPWEIRFSRLDRDGRAMANPPAPAPPVDGGTRNVPVIFHDPTNQDWPANTNAIEPQLVSTYTHEPWATPPDPVPLGKTIPGWSPGYGLAWTGQPSAGGPKTLYFTVLDENGRRARLPVTGVSRSQVAPIVAISSTGADVQEFKLVWNGRTFRLTWTETEGGRLRHVQTALTRQGSRTVFEDPSSALLRATLINGATNIDKTALPNIPIPPITAKNRNHGYGWGRLNLRQSLAPSPPVTFHVRDDNAVGVGQRARYRFYVPPGTQLLQATLVWTDPPDTGPRIVNNLNLRVIPPGGLAAGLEYHGNAWQSPPNAHLSQLVPPGTAVDSSNNIEQVVVQDPPSGIYDVEVIATKMGSTNALNQLNAQPFALVFVGSGQEERFGGVPSAGSIAIH